MKMAQIAPQDKPSLKEVNCIHEWTLKLDQMPITPETLLRGSLAHLQQAQLFQRDAVHLFQMHRVSSAVVLGTIALEHISTARWLFETSNDSKQVSELTAPLLDKLLQVKHAKRIKRGLRNPVIWQTENIRKLIHELSALPHDSEESKAVQEKIGRMLRKEQDDYPGQAHGLRERTQYVKFDVSDTSWKRTPPTTKQTQFALEAAARNYSALVHSVAKHRDAMSLVGQLGILDIFDRSGIWPSTL